MAVERDFELLDDYLANRMPVEERAAFEQKIATEPELVKELKLQQGVVESLRKTRMAELKNLLNNVPVPPLGTSLVAKVTIGIAVSALVATTLYFTLSEEFGAHEAEAPTPTIETPVTPPVEKPGQNEQPIADVEEKEESTKTEKKTTKKSRKKTQNPVVVEPKIEVFDPTAELEEAENGMDGDLLSEDEIATGKSTILVDIDSGSRRHTFHYTLKQDQLTLYGPFEHNLFEILEFFSEEKRTAFLYYKKSYYYIKEADKVTALVPVQDPALLNKLRKQRTGN
jgi:hypothetical protein